MDSTLYMCVCMCIFVCSENLVVDPTRSEESVMDGNMVVGMNIHREICVLQMTSGVAILPEQVSIAFKEASPINCGGCL